MIGLRVGTALTFFLSGFVSLMFQVAWRKALTLTIGVDFVSSTLVVTIFMLGLALGASLGSWCIRRMRVPIAGYLIAEIVVTCFGFVSMLTINAVPVLSGMLGTGVGFGGYAADFMANSILLLIPTIGMGVSFPIIVHYFRRIFGPGAAVGFLYSSNIAGAALGALFAVPAARRMFWTGNETSFTSYRLIFDGAVNLAELQLFDETIFGSHRYAWNCDQWNSSYLRSVKNTKCAK